MKPIEYRHGRRHPRTHVWLLAVLCLMGALFGCGGEKRAESSDTAADRTAQIAQWIAESQAYLDQYEDTDDIPLTRLAEEAALKAVGNDSTELAVLQLARVRMTAHYFDEAIVLLSGVLPEDRHNAEIWGMIGDAMMVTGHYRNADSCYHIMSDLDDGFASLLRIARRDELYGRFEDAVADVDRAIQGAKTWADRRDLATAYAQLASTFFAHGYLDAALQNIDESLRHLPDVVPHLAMKAEMLRVGGQSAEAVRILTELTARSTNPVYLAMLARIYQGEGNRTGADSLVAEAAKRFAELEVEYYSIVARPYVEFLLEFDVDRKKALEMAYSLSRVRKDIYAYELLAWAYYKNEKYDLAWSAIGLALRREATDPRVVYRSAVIAKATGLDDRYRVAAQRAKKANPLAAVMYGQ